MHIVEFLKTLHEVFRNEVVTDSVLALVFRTKPEDW